MAEETTIQCEQTPQGDQIVAPGVRAITLRDRLMVRAKAPMTPRRNPQTQQKPCDVGLFDMAARNQLDMLDFLRGGGAKSNSSRED